MSVNLKFRETSRKKSIRHFIGMVQKYVNFIDNYKFMIEILTFIFRRHINITMNIIIMYL